MEIVSILVGVVLVGMSLNRLMKPKTVSKRSKAKKKVSKKTKKK